MNQTKVTINLQGMEDFLNALGKDYVARVGILEDKGGVPHDNEDDLTMAELGVVHEMGSITRNIPPRSFLRMPIETRQADIVRLVGEKELVHQKFDAGDIKGIYKVLGLVAENFVQSAFSTGGFGQWPALKPATIEAKGSSKPLIDTGALRRSITSDVVRRGSL